MLVDTEQGSGQQLLRAHPLVVLPRLVTEPSHDLICSSPSSVASCKPPCRRGGSAQQLRAAWCFQGLILFLASFSPLSHEGRLEPQQPWKPNTRDGRRKDRSIWALIIPQDYHTSPFQRFLNALKALWQGCHWQLEQIPASARSS